MEALQRRADLLDVEVPRAVWARGRRPWRGAAIRIGIAAGLFLVALLVGEIAIRIAFAVAGIAVLMFTTPIVDRRLERLEGRVRAADRGQAARLLVGMDRMALVDLFASSTWVALQKGRLNLVLGNGRAAAKALADAGKCAGDPGNVALASAQVHAHVLAGDRKDARVLLNELEQKQQLSARDRLDFGIVLLEESGRTSAARAHLEAAREALGGHPRVLAALAFAYVRGDEGPRALEMLRTAETAEDLADDEMAMELIRRAKKAARPLIEAEEKRARRQKHGADSSTSSGSRDVVARPSAPGKKEKKDRRKERREKRKADRAREPSDDVDRETAERAKAEREKTEREKAEREKTEREKAELAKTEREKAEREKAEREKAEREKAEREKAEREKAEREKAAREKAEREKAEREKAAREKAEREKAEREKAEREKAARDTADKANAAPPPVFAPPPLPQVPAAPSITAPALAPPVVPKLDTATAVDADGWDDLLGDAPPPKAKT